MTKRRKKYVHPHGKPDRNRLLLEYYNTHCDEVSLTQIGKMFGISRQRVLQLVERGERGEREGAHSE